MERRRVIASVVVAVVAVAIGLWFVSGGGDDAPRRSRTALVAPGDCVDLPDDEDELLGPTDCEEPHEAQVYAEFELPDGSYPGDDVLEELADEGCVDRWGPAVGTNFYTDLSFDFVTITPDADRWEDEVREVSCLLVAAGETPLIGDQLLG